MYVTPKLAASMACPMRLGPNFTGQNAKCVGPVCMAWRDHQSDDDEDKLGYCGIAGDPYTRKMTASLVEAVEDLAGELRVQNHFKHGG